MRSIRTIMRPKIQLLVGAQPSGAGPMRGRLPAHRTGMGSAEFALCQLGRQHVHLAPGQVGTTLDVPGVGGRTPRLWKVRAAETIKFTDEQRQRRLTMPERER